MAFIKFSLKYLDSTNSHRETMSKKKKKEIAFLETDEKYKNLKRNREKSEIIIHSILIGLE